MDSNMNGGQQVAALLQPSEASSCFSEAYSHMYCHKDVVALDRGDLHQFTEPRESMPEAFCQSCVQETYPQRPGLQELVLSYPWKFWLCPRASLTTSSYSHMYCHKDVVALDRGDLHQFTEPRESMPEAFCQSCVQETYPQRPGLQELVLSYPWKFWLCPRASLTTSSTHRDHSIFEMGHLYVKPFVCHAPELQPFTV